MREVSKIVREWNGYREIFSRRQVTENSEAIFAPECPCLFGLGWMGWKCAGGGGGGGGGASRGTIVPLAFPLLSGRSSPGIDL